MSEASHEIHADQLDREFLELLNEIRVLLPGVQVLFAFLLTVPFAIGFEKVTDFERNVYAICLFSALAAIVCLVSPTTYHRIRFRHRDKDAILRASNRLTLAGSVFLAVSMTSSTLLVGDYLFDRWVAVLAAITTAFAFSVLWYGLPLARRATTAGP